MSDFSCPICRAFSHDPIIACEACAEAAASGKNRREKIEVKRFEPSKKWHLSLRSPQGFGFDLVIFSEAELLELLEALIECSNEPEGLAAHVQNTVETISAKS